MVVVVYFGGRGKLCGPILMTTVWVAENTCISFMVIFFCQENICIAPIL